MVSSLTACSAHRGSRFYESYSPRHGQLTHQSPFTWQSSPSCTVASTAELALAPPVKARQLPGQPSAPSQSSCSSKSSAAHGASVKIRSHASMVKSQTRVPGPCTARRPALAPMVIARGREKYTVLRVECRKQIPQAFIERKTRSREGISIK